MASIRIESICCLIVENSTDVDSPNEAKKLSYVLYNAFCIVSASVSIIGSIYQIFPRSSPAQTPRNEGEQVSSQRQNYIINWLAVADMLASIGILVRASVWIAGYAPTRDPEQHVDFQHIFCAAISGWIQFCYICTYFWTFCYALDVYRLVHKQPSFGFVYHILGWIVPGLLCLLGLLPFYTPKLSKCGSELQYAILHYLVTYVPMLLVMIGNPILYYRAQKEVQTTLRSRGLYTNQERAILRGIQKKFALVMLVFYVCWLPNVIDGILILVQDPTHSRFMVALWHFMALVNPLQSFLNSLVYRGVNSSPCSCLCACCKIESSTSGQSIIQASHNALEESTEVSPLLSFRKSGNYSSRSGQHSGSIES